MNIEFYESARIRTLESGLMQACEMLLELALKAEGEQKDNYLRVIQVLMNSLTSTELL